MLDKKYIFETRGTRLRRVFINSSLMITTFILILSTICISIPMYGRREYKASQSKLYKKAPDLIAIYTGGAGRIAFGVELAKNYPTSKIFISGVYNKNTVETLFEKQVKPLEEAAEKKLEEAPVAQTDGADILKTPIPNTPELVEIDYQARNTLENVIYTLNYLRKSKEHRHIAIISSDYHILRIKLIMDTIRDSRDKDFDFTYLGMETDFNDWSSIKLVVKEVFKLIKTSAILLFWDKEHH